MKKKITFICLVLVLLLSGCNSSSYERNKNSGAVFITSIDELDKKMKAKDTFVIIFAQTNCPACENLHEMLSTYLLNHYVNPYELIIDLEFETTQIAKEKLKKYFPDVNSSPTVYYIKNGEIKSEFKFITEDAEGSFDEWVQDNQLDRKQ